MASEGMPPHEAHIAESIEVERIGGFAGYGLPGAHLRSRGLLVLATLSSAEQIAVNMLFCAPPACASSGCDTFRYQLTRQTLDGPQTIVAPESEVPLAVQQCVHDEFVP